MSGAATVFNAMARYLQRPTLSLVSHQPTLRLIFDLQARLTYRSVSGVSFAPARYGNVAGLEIRPEGVTGPPSLLYLHGGGFTIGSSRTHKYLVGRIAKAAARAAFLPDYRLAPEQVFPAAVEDAEVAFAALAKHGDVAVAGDSAGGALALGLCATHRPERAALLSPLVDLRDVDAQSAAVDLTGEILLPEAWIRRAIGLYLDGAKADTPQASPILHNLSQAPPVLIQAAQGEILEAHAQRASKALPDVRLSLTPNAAHVWQLNAGWMPEADRAVAEIGAFLKQG